MVHIHVGLPSTGIEELTIVLIQLENENLEIQLLLNVQ